MWCSEITTVTCPINIPTRGNREEFGGNPRSHWQTKIKIKLLVWSAFSYLCQDKQSSNSSPSVKMGWRREQAQPSSKHSSRDNTTSQGTLVCLALKLHQQTANFGVWGHGDKAPGATEMKDSELQGVWSVQSNPCTDPPLCVLCSLQLTHKPRLHSEVWTEWEHLGQSFFSDSISWGYSWVRLSGLHRHRSARNRCSFSLRKITHK